MSLLEDAKARNNSYKEQKRLRSKDAFPQFREDAISLIRQKSYEGETSCYVHCPDSASGPELARLLRGDFDFKEFRIEGCSHGVSVRWDLGLEQSVKKPKSFPKVEGFKNEVHITYGMVLDYCGWTILNLEESDVVVTLNLSNGKVTATLDKEQVSVGNFDVFVFPNHPDAKDCPFKS